MPHAVAWSAITLTRLWLEAVVVHVRDTDLLCVVWFCVLMFLVLWYCVLWCYVVFCVMLCCYTAQQLYYNSIVVVPVFRSFCYFSYVVMYVLYVHL